MPKNDSQKIQSVTISAKQGKKIRWINIINAEKKEIEWLGKKFAFSEADLHSARIRVANVNAKIRAGTDYLFVILRFPFYDHAAKTIAGAEIDFFVGQDYAVTLHADKITALRDLFGGYPKQPAASARQIDSGIDLFYVIVDELLDHSFILLDDVRKKTDTVENLICSANSTTAAGEMLGLRRSAINIRTLTQNYQNILEKFQRLTEEIGLIDKRTPYAAVAEKTKDLSDMVENRKAMIEALYATHESISSYRLSDIMKTLTTFSVILIPLTLIASIFGMNTTLGMPFMDNEYGFEAIVGIMLMVLAAMLFFFKHKKWL